MTERTFVKARVNLFGLLRALEELVALDVESASLLEDKDETLEFVISGGIRGYLVFRKGTCAFGEGRADRPSIRLWFFSAEHFNRMVEGTATPVPLKGLLKIGFLTKTFTALAARLESFLKPEEGALDDPEFFRINTRLTAFVAFHALSEIGNWDETGRHCAEAVPDGAFQFRVEDGEGPHLYVESQGGRLITRRGTAPEQRCVFWFRDLRAVNDILNGTVGTYAAFGQGRAGVRGFVPMAENLSPLLGLIPGYLA